MSTMFEQAWGGTFVRKAAQETPSLPSTAQEREAAFTALLQSGSGLKRVAFAMQTPLKNRLDYVAVGRKLLLVDELPQGEIPAYDLDIPEYGAVRIAARGVPPVHETNIKRLEIPTWSLSINTAIKWEEITVRRYPVFDRAKERTAISMAIAEDDEIFKVVEAAAQLAPTSGGDTFTSSLVKNDLAGMYAKIASRQLVPGAYVMSPLIYGDILKWNSDWLDQVSLNVVLETGQFGVIFGTKLIVSTRILENSSTAVYCVTTPDKLGRIPERKAVEVKIFDNVNDAQYNIVAWEQIGIGIHNPAGVAKIRLTGT